MADLAEGVKKSPVGKKWTLDTVRQRCAVDGDCWIWTKCTNVKGYPQSTIDRVPQLIGRWVLNQMLADQGRRPLISKECATPSCGNRMCVSPLCLQKVTRSKILKDTFTSGARSKKTERRSGKLTAEQVLEIRDMKEILGAVELGQKFSVQAAAIRRIWNGKAWKETPANSVFTWRPAA